MTDATPEQIVAFLTGGRTVTDLGPTWIAWAALMQERDGLRAENERLNALVATMANDLTKAGARELDALAERDEWRERYEAEHRDHLATIKHADALEDECHKLERE